MANTIEFDEDFGTGSYSAGVLTLESSGEAPPPAPEIVVTRGVTTIVDGSTDPLGTIELGATTILTYGIANSGDGDLTLGAVALGTGLSLVATGDDPNGVVLAPLEQFTMRVSVNTLTEGVFSGRTISLANDDTNENPANWTVGGTVTDTTDPVRSGIVAPLGQPYIYIYYTDVSGLDTGSVPDPSDLTHSAKGIIDDLVTTSYVRLTCDSDFELGGGGTTSYTPGTNKIRDASIAHNLAAAFSGQAVNVVRPDAGGVTQSGMGFGMGFDEQE